MKAVITTIDEEFEKSRVKAHVRTRKGKLERVKEFERKGSKKLTIPSGIERLAQKGYDEFKEVLTGKTSVDKFIEIVTQMGYSQPESAREWRLATRYGRAADVTAKILGNQKKLTKEQAENLRDAIDQLPMEKW